MRAACVCTLFNINSRIFIIQTGYICTRKYQFFCITYELSRRRQIADRFFLFFLTCIPRKNVHVFVKRTRSTFEYVRRIRSRLSSSLRSLSVCAPGYPPTTTFHSIDSPRSRVSRKYTLTMLEISDSCVCV